jgi:hypothetical protein
MFPLVFYGVCDSGSGYHYRLLRASLTSLLRNYSGQVLIAADRELKIPCDRVRVVKVDVDDYYYGAFELRLRLGEFIQGLPTRTYPLDHLRVLYLDDDTIVTRPLDGLFRDCDRHDGIYYAPEDPEWHPGSEYHGRYVMTGEEGDEAARSGATAYNAGVYLTTWKFAAPVFEKYRALYRAALNAHAHVPLEMKPGLSDQSALNTLIHRKTINAIPFPRHHVQTCMSVGTSEPLPTIMHFASGARPRMKLFLPPDSELISIEGKELQFESPKLPKVLYLNRPDFPGRRACMEDQLIRLGFSFERVNAPLAADAGEFRTPQARANWLSHVELIERVARDNYPYLILEDDAVIRSPEYILSAINLLRSMNVDWAFLFFYGVPERPVRTIERLQHAYDLHAYMVNPRWAFDIARELRSRYDWLLKNGEKSFETFIDYYTAHTLQPKMPFFGTQNCVYQDRNRFGSHTGWR